jgi:multidrug efflux pump subunit AcrB
VPPNVKLETTFEQSTYIENAIRSLQADALLGASIVILVLLVFLASFTSTIIVALSLPLAFLATLVVLYLTGETINVFTLGGLALAIGRLVDNAIIVLEVIHRHQSEGKPPLQAALDGAREVAAPVLAGTLTTIIVFIPIWFLSGISKYLFTPMGLTIGASMVASYIVSLTVIPVLMRRFGAVKEVPPEERSVFRRASDVVFGAFERFLAALDRGHGRILDWVLLRKKTVLIATFLAFIGSLALAREIGSDFFPPIDEGEVQVKVRAPIGTRLEETEALAARVEQLVEEVVPEDVLVGTNTSIGAPKGGLRAMLSSNSGPHELTVRLELTPPGQREHDINFYIEKMRARAEEEFPGISVVFDPRGTIREIINFGHKAPIVVEVSGYDLAEGSALAADVVTELKTVPGLTDVKSIRQDDYPNLRVDVDRERAARFGIHQDDVAMLLLGSVFGNMSRAPFMVDPETGFPYDIITRLAAPYRDDLNDLQEITLQHEGKPIMLKSIASIRRSTGPLMLERRDIQRIAEVTANLSAGTSVSDAAEEIRERLAKLDVPEGFTVDIVGQAKDQEETNKSLFAALGLAMCVVYMVMAVQFRSLLHPLVIMFTVPLGLIGVFVAMFVTNTTFSATSVMGIIMMVGIVVANGILLVDSANHKRSEEGSTPDEAALVASKLRLRPILMTSLTLELGLIPMAIGGPGGELYAPLARAVMGGLLASTVLTLYVIPVLYALAERWYPTDTTQRNADDAIIDAS